MLTCAYIAYDSELGNHTEDPIRDGRNWYAYVLNNPLRFVDPTGLLTDENREALQADLDSYGGEIGFDDYQASRISYYEGLERENISNLQANLNNLKESGDPWLAEEILSLDNEILEYMGLYNRDIVPTSVEDYGGDVLTGSFEDDYIIYFQDPHPGIDQTSSTDTGFKSPFYMIFNGANTGQSSNPVTFVIPGTNYHGRLKHSDQNEVESLIVQSQQNDRLVFSPNSTIVPYPKNQNPGAIHFHWEMRDTTATLVNPIGLTPGTYDSYNYNYGTSDEPDWGSMNLTW